MKRYLILMVGLLGLAACAGPPKIYSLADTSNESGMACEKPFPVGDWQFLHTVEAQFTGGKKSVLMGVTDIYSQSNNIRSVIMTVEGLVLFEAEYGRKLLVLRGIPPFDSHEFAQGLMDDIHLIFFRPQGEISETGRLQNGAMICRYEDGNGRMIDTIINTNGSWELRQYDQHNRLGRRVRSLPPEQPAASLPGVLELMAQGKRPYRLKMTLVKATRIR